IQRESYRCFSLVDQPLQLLAAAHAANEIDSLVGADVFDTQYGIKHQILENTHVQRGDSPLRRRDIGTQTERVPLAVKIHSPLSPPLRRFATAFRHFKTLFYCFNKLAGRQAIQIAHGTVVSKYLDLVIGENNRQEEVIFFVAGMTEALFPEFGACPRGAGGAVMTISNVKERYLAKGMNKAHCIGHMPDGVLNSVFRGEVENGIRHRRLHHHGVYLAAG